MARIIQIYFLRTASGNTMFEREGLPGLAFR